MKAASPTCSIAAPSATCKTKLLSKLSKGYRQRVGLAQAIIHNPDVLILDEPTAGLDPKQINETRDLIKSLAGDHTIILSTHILPEVEQTCESVIIINKGKLVATDSVHNLQARARGAESVLVSVGVHSGEFPTSIVRDRLQRIPGVSGTALKEEFPSGAVFEIESNKGQLVRGDLARAIVEAGWDLNELRPSAMSLEEIFLQLTGSDAAASTDRSERAGSARRDSRRRRRMHEKYLDHLPPRAIELLRVAHRMAAAGHVQRHLRMDLLEFSG